MLDGLAYSPDGKRIMARDVITAVIQVWDVQTRKQLSSLDTGLASRHGAASFFLAPDWKTIYDYRSKSSHSMVERNGKALNSWKFDGEIRAWDLETGKLRHTLRHDPPRSVGFMRLSPAGSQIYCREDISGETAQDFQSVITLWDVTTRQPRSLPDAAWGIPKFSSDDKLLAISVRGPDRFHTESIRVLDVATLKEMLSIPISEKFAFAYPTAFTPDGKFIIGDVRLNPSQKERIPWQSYLRFWDAKTGKEVASFRAEHKNTDYQAPKFAPDGKSFATVEFAYQWKDLPCKLFLFDSAGRRLFHALVLNEKLAEGDSPSISDPVFSPDGRWVATATRIFPKDAGSEDSPQARIHLVDVEKGAIRETMIAPQGSIHELRFSPDGRTLAAGGSGKVLLWDVGDICGAK